MRAGLEPVIASLAVALASVSADEQTFPPPADPPRLKAAVAAGPMEIDGVLSEPSWSAANLASGFRQIDPDQGAPAIADTRVRIVFDEEQLYIGAEMDDPEGAAGLRVPTLQRDFSPTYFGTAISDVFGVSIDPFGDRRTAFTFQVTPYGAQRDALVFDSSREDVRWDAAWEVATTRGANGWTAELAIPWKTLRYREGAHTFAINFVRIHPRVNSVSGWSPWPRAYAVHRMAYAGVLTELHVGSPAFNLQLRPFALGEARRREVGVLDLSADLGADLKWAPTPSSVVDVTVNTDFAEADVDRLVLNLERYSVYFPERRPFFLESAQVFGLGDGDDSSANIEPFFSRRIGLSARGTPVPIDAGARYVLRSPEQTAGALLLHTRGTDEEPGATFGVARYSHNLGEESRAGAALIARFDETTSIAPSRANIVPAVDGLVRLGSLTMRGMSSVSIEKQHLGAGGFYDLDVRGNWGYVGISGAIATREYFPRAGFVSREDFIRTAPYLFFDARPAWRPPWIRSIRAAASFNLVHRASTRRFQEASLYVEPLWLQLESGDDLWVYGTYDWQHLDEPFEPVPGARFPGGDFRDGVYGAAFESNRSRSLYLLLRATRGRYFGAKHISVETRVAISPVPHVRLSGTYFLQHFRELPERNTALAAHLLIGEVRLALNARLQLSGVVQHDASSGLSSWNARLAWEYLPLSYVYVVYNGTHREPAQNWQVLLKLSHTWQI